jgi:hypothetical protein
MRALLPPLLCSCAALLLACGGGDKVAGGGGAEADEKPAEASPGVEAAKPAGDEPAKAAAPSVDDESRPPSERIKGRWRMNVDEVPDTALTEDFRKWKQQGKGDQLRIEYTITEADFTLDSWGPRGRMQKKWHYEITKEMDNSLMLKRIGDDGQTQDIPAVLKDGKLIIGTGAGEVPLERIE